MTSNQFDMNSLKLILLFCFFFHVTVQAQVDTRNWCQGHMHGDEKGNNEFIHRCMKDESIVAEANSGDVKKIPLRIGIIQTGQEKELVIKEIELHRAVTGLNKAFHDAHFVFYIDRVDIIESPLKLEDLQGERYGVYNDFSDKHDVKDMISIYVFDHGKEFCKVNGNSISCGRTGGFSYILSERTSNVVMSRFDITDVKVLAHELGHFWGLYHTFEEAQFGKDNFDPNRCTEVGDRICDTPPDPGTIYEIYVNYSNCELYNLTNEDGKEYKPMIENYMSYYKPCYLKEFSFTPQQLEIMMIAATQPIRSKYVR